MIPVDKTDIEIPKEKRAKQKIDMMSKDLTDICESLSQSTKFFNAEEVFIKIDSYVKKHDRLLYAEISNYIFQLRSDEAVSIFQTNLGLVLEHVLSDEYSNKIEREKDKQKRFQIEKSRKIVLKMYDHINLAKRQYKELKDSDDDFEKRFKKSFENHQVELTKEMSNQLVTLVGIFTAIAFVVFGGISSLDNLFSSAADDVSLLRLLVVGTLWSLCMTNLVYIFLFCVGKITKLSIKSSDDPNDNLVQKYPIIFWSNYIFITLITVFLWIYFLNLHNNFKWLYTAAKDNGLTVTIIGSIIIILVFGFTAKKLVDLRKKR